MKYLLLGSFVFLSASLSGVLSAQAPAASDPAKDPMATWLRGAYRNNRNYLARTIEKVPEDMLSLRPGAQTEVRTFGQIVGHVANFNFLWCSQAKGETNPNKTDFEKTTSKAALAKGLNDALTYCDGVYAALTDAAGLQTVTITQESGREAQMLRMSLLTLNYGHNNEHYGNLVTMMRMKNMVPPSSEPARP